MRPGRYLSPHYLGTVSNRLTRVGYNSSVQVLGNPVPFTFSRFMRDTREVFMSYLRSNPQRVVEEALHETR